MLAASRCAMGCYTQTEQSLALMGRLAARKRREAEPAHEVHQKEIAQREARETAIKGFW